MKSNKFIVFFLIKFFGTYALLSFLYGLYLNNTQHTSNFFTCAPITETVANQTVAVLNTFGYEASVAQHPNELSLNLTLNNVIIARVIEGCNAISIIILFISFIVSFSTTFWPTFLYIVIGSFIIYAINVLRIAIICIALYKYPNYQYVLHDLLFPSIIYGITFLLWFVWIQKFSKLKK
ncbi:exosortase family protein XrtF [Lutibacter holmesii]|uniref:Exosortase family protein XrtF n=1 Tax=Lutibacter holmesii TaxID=1137985 RepID=A0ABW3WNV9_9FLAO